MGLNVITPKVGLAAWGKHPELTQEELIRRLEGVATTATAKGGDGLKARY